MPKEYQIMLACNDPDNGNFAGHVTAIEICERGGDPDPILTLDDGDVKLAIEKDHIKISRKKFTKRGHGSWVGNWCWDCVWMTAEETVALLNYLRTNKRRLGFSPSEGLPALYDAWDKGEVITVEMLQCEEVSNEQRN